MSNTTSQRTRLTVGAGAGLAVALAWYWFWAVLPGAEDILGDGPEWSLAWMLGWFAVTALAFYMVVRRPMSSIAAGAVLPFIAFSVTWIIWTQFLYDPNGGR